MSVKWIKIVTNIFDDEKIRLIETLPDSDTVLVIWFKLLTMAAKCCDNGVVYLTREIPYTPEMLSTLMRRPVNTIRMALTEFQRLGMIDIENDFISILNWEKHQAMDKLEMAKEQTRKRVAKHREKQKEVCNVTSPLQVTQCNADRLDKDIDKDIDIYNMFDKWWDLYDKKRGKDKASKEWIKIFQNYGTIELFDKIMNHTSIYISFTEKVYRKDPERYLKYRSWEDEVVSKNNQKSFREKNAFIDSLSQEELDNLANSLNTDKKLIGDK